MLGVLCWVMLHADSACHQVLLTLGHDADFQSQCKGLGVLLTPAKVVREIICQVRITNNANDNSYLCGSALLTHDPTG